MTRYWLSLGALAAVLMAASPSQAAQPGPAPWCATVNVGWGDLIQDCSYWTFAACRDDVVAGNRGFCDANPRYTGPMEPAKRRARR